YMLARIVALFAWVKALRVPEQPEDIMTEGDLMLNVERLTWTWRDITIDMTHNEFRMVKELVNRPGHVKTRDQLMDAAGVVQADNSITSSIKRIRRKFVEVDDTFDHIKAVHGVGYRWSGE
ncbi:MAG: winged helix-turn-helix domain-containing protein, partial [Halioglobus sp.]|nr:winged helix-turn-helix domain-containing protein [Halioglobus sp.]